MDSSNNYFQTILCGTLHIYLTKKKRSHPLQMPKHQMLLNFMETSSGIQISLFSSHFSLYQGDSIWWRTAEGLQVTPAEMVSMATL